MRYIHRYGKSACKLLFTLNPAKSTNEAGFHRAVESFGEHISRQLRKSDTMVRIKEQQYFLLLPEINSEDIDRLVARLLKNWSADSLSSEADITYEKELIISQGKDYALRIQNPENILVLGKKCSGAATGNSRRSPLPCFMISVMSVLSELATFNKIEFDFHLKFGTTIFE